MLSMVHSTAELQWRDDGKTLTQEGALLHLLALAEKSVHRSENTYTPTYILTHLC